MIATDDLMVDNLTITDEMVVSLSYELRSGSDKGEVIETVPADNPLTFLSGAGNLLPKFEENIAGLNVGQKFKFSLTPEEAYGVIDQENIVDLPVTMFQVDGKLNTELVQIGRTVPMQDRQGNRYNGMVREIKAETVKIDFNHPLAGKTLFFSGSVVDLREATQEELEHGHIHADGGCGCNSGGCGCH